jgi:hypothetical protein
MLPYILVFFSKSPFPSNPKIHRQCRDEECRDTQF